MGAIRGFAMPGAVLGQSLQADVRPAASGGSGPSRRGYFLILKWSPLWPESDQSPRTVSHPAYNGHRRNPPE